MDFAGAFSPANLGFLMDGLYITLIVAFVSIILSFVIGVVVGVIRYAEVPVLSPVMFFLVELIRNLPLLLIIFFVRFALPEVGIKMGLISAAIAALTVFEAAMIAEIVRGGLNAVDKGQIEAARSSGLSSFQTLWHIVLPQGLRHMVPPLVSQFISLLKDTSLATIVALPELMHNAKIVMGQKESYTIPILIMVALMYFVVNYLLSLISKRLEHKTA
ncbi:MULTISPECIES: amino acid ABC transporter permease [unclassified Paenibacillus]|uniref:amino acid ABC transporter permease n=1 Tax=unclassified Paenibacillus TaxID=185978 RepID=UPI002406B258|nr:MULTISPECIES: amino acid ABC transporter permease [unclassified Paenibacillus]MDF9844601.1 putative glutamine transport system permease protein [Paenibacillus sp. PastF-2]MDF9851221.1 putative glutamine transport system permease protein [Paenibacillus sp. PastM-2]MDF9857786.1 putative glutamine transport system permease protein [Paenibacillus sp. PastF-1]MDH6483070.1 putative glutamine transport system permease protein [Paenibacillus sp. PastH-2]MDH6510466.1 putative glutamine transport sys